MVAGVSLLDGPSGAINFLMTGFATLAICVAAILLLVVVLVPRLRESAGLPSTILALVGAIVARFTTQNTVFGDEVFRDSTVYWSVALALTSAVWWGVASAKNKPHPPQPVVHKPSLSPGESTSAVAVKTRPRTDAAKPASATRTSNSAPNAVAKWGALVLGGAASIAIAVATFLTSTGIFPVSLPL